MSISSFSSHVMMSLHGDEVHILIQGMMSQENPSVISLNITKDDDIKRLQEISSQHFQSSVLTVYSPEKTIVPKSIFNADDKAQYLKFNFGLDGHSDHIKSDYVRQVDSNLIYSENKNLTDILKFFPETRISHVISVLLEAHLRSSIATQSKQVSVYCHDGHTEIIASDGKNLLFTNGFQVHNPEDYTYYVVYVLDMLGFNLKESKIRICGNIRADYFDLLKQYCPNAGYHRFEYDLNVGKNLSNKAYANDVILLNQYQCV
ncbi:MAG: hypothetical protein ACI81Y_000576 [Glaciecola sp.]